MKGGVNLSEAASCFEVLNAGVLKVTQGTLTLTLNLTLTLIGSTSDSM